MLHAINGDIEAKPYVDLRPLLYGLTLDTATELFLGRSTDILSHTSSGSDSEGMRFSSAFNEAIRWLATRDRFKMFCWLVQGPEFNRVCSDSRNSLERLIANALASQPPVNDHSALRDVVAQTPSLSKARDEFMNLFFAARDSTSSLLCWLFYALAREPRVYQKIQKEIFSILGLEGADRIPTESDLAQMHYLDAVISETLRLFPPVPINGRTCSETTNLPTGGGINGQDPIFVPKGTVICFSTYGTHRSRDYYGEDAALFRPERWETNGSATETVKTRTWDYSFHPFIGGPRKCLGGKL